MSLILLTVILVFLYLSQVSFSSSGTIVIDLFYFHFSVAAFRHLVGVRALLRALSLWVWPVRRLLSWYLGNPGLATPSNNNEVVN